MGTGHLMRMIALAQAWRETGGDIVFVCAEITGDLESRICGENLRVEKSSVVPGSHADLEATYALIARYSADNLTVAVALDGYQFDAEFQHGLKAAGCRLLAVDDYGHADFYCADFVLNQNVSACESLYAKRSSDTRLLLGPKYSLLRREFAKLRGWERRIPDRAGKLLVTLGGADADNLTEKVIGALAGASFEIKVAVGGSNPHLDSLLQATRRATSAATRVELVVNPLDMPDLMAWADIAVTAGGSTCWELALAGLPSLLIILAENQARSTRELERQGFGCCLGKYDDFDAGVFRQALESLAADKDRRAGFAARGREMVDGFGAQRVVSFLSGIEEFGLRPVTEADFELLWRWVNDPVTRDNSFESGPIPWDRHESWCQTKLHDPQCHFLVVASAQLGEMGCVRFDLNHREATISVSLSPHARGRGLGARVIARACERMFSAADAKTVHAFIKPDNAASIAAFKKAGFRRQALTTVKGLPAEHLLLQRGLP